MMLFWYILLLSGLFFMEGVAQNVGSPEHTISRSRDEINMSICRQIESVNNNRCPKPGFNITLEEYYNNNTGIYTSPYYYKNCLPKREALCYKPRSKSINGGLSILIVFIIAYFIIPLTKNQPQTALGYYCAINHPIAYYTMMNSKK